MALVSALGRALAASVLLASATACSDDTDATDPGASPSESTSESTSESSPDPSPEEPSEESTGSDPAASVCDRIDTDALSQRVGVRFGDTGPTGEPGGAETCVFSSRDGGLVTYVDVSAERTPLREALIGVLGQAELTPVTVAGEEALVGEAPPGAGLAAGGVVSHVGDRTFTVIVGDVNAKPRREALDVMPLAVAEMIIAAG